MDNKILISTDELKDFLFNSINSKILSRYTKKYLKYIFNFGLNIHKYRHIYYKKNSNSSYKLYNIYTNKDINFYYKIKIINMINSFVVNHIDEKLFKKKISDEEILKFIVKNKLKNIKDTTSEFRLYKLANAIGSFKKEKNIKLLDVGIGNGKKTIFLRDFLECKIYGTDIKKWGPYNVKRKFDFPFKFIQIDPYKIPYTDYTFDCVVLNLVLHHANNIYETINECKRVLKKDGIIVIIEHDVWSDYDNIIIDFQHDIYTTLFNEKKEEKGNYYNYFEWDLIFKKCNMESIYGTRLQSSIDYYIKYDNTFLGIYSNINNNN